MNWLMNIKYKRKSIKAVTAAIKSPLSCERPAEMPGLELGEKEV